MLNQNRKQLIVRRKKIVSDNIILAQAKSDDEKLEQEIAFNTEFKDTFKLIFNSSSDVLFDSDLINE